MTLVLDESAVGNILSMSEVVKAVENCFKQAASSQAVNTPRNRTTVRGAVLNVMHASLPYLGRAGVKCYLSSKKGTRFVFILFSLADAEPLAVMGADILGRYRTGAASAVATKYLAGLRSMKFAIAGTGKQALTQVLAMKEVAKLESVTAWSPTRAHLSDFVFRLAAAGVESSAASSLENAFLSADVATTITTSRLPFVRQRDVANLIHLNLCGSNLPVNAEANPGTIASFRTVVTDDVEQAKNEAGDLVLAESAGMLSWKDVVQLGDIVSGRVKPIPKTLFKSNGVALEDVAVASVVYDKARRSSEFATANVDIVK